MIKRIIFDLLCNTFTGSIISKIFGNKIPNLRYSNYSFAVNSEMDKRIVASIFFGFYEGAEIRFIEKYFKGDVDVVELGASSGIVSAHIVSRFVSNKQRLLSVEANKKLENTWTTNVKRHNKKGSSVTLRNEAVYYDGQTVSFAVSDNPTESRLGNETPGNSQQIIMQATTLQKLVSTGDIGNYMLFCDIEGAELQIFINELTDTWDKCRYILIELHESSYKDLHYTVEQLHALIQTKGFTLIDRHGPVCYYRNSKSSW